MRPWMKIWLSAWRSERVVLASPLSEPVVRKRLAEGRISYLRASVSMSGEGGYRVVGRVGERRIRVEAARVGVRNSWRPVLRGRLESVGTGCRLVGRIGWHPFVKAFTVLWLGLVVAMFLGLAGRAVVLVWTGEATGEDALACLFPLGFLLFFVAMTVWATQVGRREGIYLRSWLANRLQTAETAIPGNQPGRGLPPTGPA